MYKVTRKFISERNKFAQPYGVAHIPNVKRIGGGLEHDCYQNACAFVKKNPLNIEVAVWSGWLIQPYDKATNSTLILAHWWNITKNGEHIDTTPLYDAADYVQDYALMKFCSQSGEKLKTHLAHSILYKDENFYLITDPMTNKILPMLSLSNETLYKEKWN
jgi:hypothetical protein